MLSSYFSYTATEMEPAPAFPPYGLWSCQTPGSPTLCPPTGRTLRLSFPPHSTTLSSNLLLQPWQLKHMFSSLHELKLGDGEREEKGINEVRRESRGGKGVEVSGGFFMVIFNYKQPAWWEDTALNIQRDP